jgi:hypothetical protein
LIRSALLLYLFYIIVFLPRCTFYPSILLPSFLSVSNLISSHIPKTTLSSFVSFLCCYVVNAGKSFTLETALPVNDGNLNALSMYNSLIGVAFDNGGEICCLFRVSSYFVSFYIVSPYDFIHFELSLTTTLIHSYKPHAGNSYVKQSAPTSMPSYSPNFVSSRPTSTPTKSPIPAPTNTPTVVRTPYGPYRPYRWCHWRNSADVIMMNLIVVATVSVKNENEYISSQNTLIDLDYTPSLPLIWHLYLIYQPPTSTPTRSPSVGPTAGNQLSQAMK